LDLSVNALKGESSFGSACLAAVFLNGNFPSVKAFQKQKV